MLLRSLLACAGLCLLSACTIPLWGENDADKVDPAGGLPPSKLEIPPDLSRPANSTTYEIPRTAANSTVADKNQPAVAAAAPAPVAGRDLETRLKEIQDLRDKGLITEQELQAKRKALLDSL